MHVFRICLAFALSLLTLSCARLPETKLQQWQDDSWANFDNDTLSVYLHNPLRCPLRFKLSSTDAAFNQKLKPYSLVTLHYNGDTLIKIPALAQHAKTLRVSKGLGDPNEELQNNKLSLPFLPGRSYTVIQAYNGSFSHSDAYSRCAVDFSLKEGDTVCAATEGYVVGIVKDYKEGGADKKWRDYANFITIYDPANNRFLQYAHLKHNSVLVEMGDRIEPGQPIALAGRTGWTSIQHLHFNVLKAVDTADWLESVPADYYEGYNGSNLKQGDVVTRPAE
ncbi:M23 family metallopeptidase [Flavobacterium akiainvivens]|uniref:M23 family metallopeptidase n=1 Tax=Flavobacterium akiainvivens TaxID=1202724 RepID=UPI0006C89480|nr:M23 family metallopeptidase [Flavobacterium akiainvivens]SFQ33546.1 Murein DD-endopeptidase MepM and murein hydrolase activator NlpD, contain LysM domain [Flavobacterium akiainvivens]